MKKVILVFITTFSLLFSSNDYDKDIIVLDQSRDDKVKIVFEEMMQAYEDEDYHEFFDFISEERFIQDYMTFTEAIDKDFRDYETISFDKWIDKITSDGVKKYLYVKWEKYYETNNGSNQATQNGYSRFLFDEINGEYKLIELAGNNLWGVSLKDWTDEVTTIPGQEAPTTTTSTSNTNKPDLEVIGLTCNSFGEAEFYIRNNGSADANSTIEYSYEQGFLFSAMTDTYSGPIFAGSTSSLITQPICSSTMLAGDTVKIVVDPNDSISESNESNNTSIYTK